MSNIVERLRNTYEWVGFPAVPLCVEAADEIGRLQAENDYWGKRAEKAEADLELRRMVYYGDIIIMTSEIEQMCEENARLQAELQYIYDNGIEIGGDECAEVARRALEVEPRESE